MTIRPGMTLKQVECLLRESAWGFASGPSESAVCPCYYFTYSRIRINVDRDRVTAIEDGRAKDPKFDIKPVKVKRQPRNARFDSD